MPEEKSEFRNMTEADLPDVLAIENAAHLAPWTEGIFKDCMRVGYVCLLARFRGELVGYGVMSVAAGEAHLFNICVAPEHQHKGYGGLILHRLFLIAEMRKATIMFLEVRPSNTRALNLYSREGFNQVGVRENYYPAGNGREDALILARNL